MPDCFSGLLRWWRSFAVAPLVRADADARAWQQAHPGVDWKSLTVLVGVAVLLTVQRYFAMSDGLYRALDLLRALGFDLHVPSARQHLAAMLYWALATSACYFIGPALVIRLAFGERLADYGFKLRGAFADGWVYLVMFAIMVPLVWWTSATARFQYTYPFYRPPPGPLGWDFLAWEACYALQFVTLEFFFRGFLVHGTKHRFGAYAIPVMMIPYCMIHFGKPLLETLAAIVAGLALGFMSLKTRSVALGAAIHITVAVSMDLASLWRQGFFA
jgi:membrane protease YdiL (CAAX protease family)